MSAPRVAARRRRAAEGQMAMEEVRRLVARELHDRVVQTLTGMLIDVENFKSQPVGWSDVLHEMDTIQSSTRQVLNSLRQMLHDLRGEEQQIGKSFVEAVTALVARFKESTEISAELDVKPGWPAALSPTAALNLYRIVEEALNNVRMHSGARSVAILLAAPSADTILLEIGDDGRGLDTHPSRPVGLGTVGMRERALFLGGQLSIEGAIGKGTTVRALFPKIQLERGLEPEVASTPGLLIA